MSRLISQVTGSSVSPALSSTAFFRKISSRKNRLSVLLWSSCPSLILLMRSSVSSDCIFSARFLLMPISWSRLVGLLSVMMSSTMLMMPRLMRPFHPGSVGLGMVSVFSVATVRPLIDFFCVAWSFKMMVMSRSRAVM